ncbi:GTP 3',8-cyclase MoaA [Infirmifilum lucidum]|uniref:Probable GTP 3',8-cyclase n=1 Tax=Infirmifilum lucidum TaxID=2776706 RepID=A0A7L9FE51_9CREN|nr:GTP 3',8-cyclase MoaA [Infirmifilum lucidum]QOJ78070.1 GTP 3',8-cyclase MoaA [Infirmifilum lucidum]
MLVDRFGRPLTNLRISVTSKCNYACIFCHREGEESTADKLSTRDIELVARAAYSLGIKTFKLTGGEPLIRPDIEEIVSGIKSISRDVEVSATTNGYFLLERAKSLQEAGLDRLNVSLHAISPVNYNTMTGVRGSERVIKGLHLARDLGIPVKLNFVLTKYNVVELPQLLDFASKMSFDINIIELIPEGKGRENFHALYYPVEKVLPMLAEKSSKIERRSLHNRPVFILDTGIRVEVIANYCNPMFCLGCTRIRLTHDAKLKPCLNRNDNLVDIGSILHGGDTSQEEKLRNLVDAIKLVNSLREPFFKLNGNKCISYKGSLVGEPRKI